MATGWRRAVRRKWVGVAVLCSLAAVACNHLNRTLPAVESSTTLPPGHSSSTSKAPGPGSTQGGGAPGASSTSGTFSAPSTSSASGGGGAGASTSQPTGAPPTSSPGTISTGNAAASNVDGSQPVSVSFPGHNPLAVLTSVRDGQHDTFERAVFEFRENDAIPGVQVGYATQPITMDGSGAPVTVAGDRVIVVRMQTASRFDTAVNPPPRLYTGPDRIPGNRSPVTEVVFIGDFEGRLSWAIGVVGNPAFTLNTTTHPTRVAVDVQPANR